MANILLEMRNITKTFPGVKALNNVNFQVEEGEIHALVGENGAGKSTLMKVLSGIHAYGSYEGEVLYNGQVCKFSNIKDSEKLGIVIIHQELALVPELTIGENMFLGNERGSKFAINWNKTYAEADKYLRMVGLEESSKTQIKDIGTGKQQLVEIAKALAKNAKLLILDEPTSSLNEEDSRALLDLMLSFKQQGMTMIIITHKLNEVAYVADKITVLRDGATIETIDNDAEHVSEDRIIKGMVGREITNRFPKRYSDESVAASATRKDADVISRKRKAAIKKQKVVPSKQAVKTRKSIISDEVKMEVRNWTVHHPLYPERKVVDDVSLYVRKGEVVGIYGLMGAGRTELCMSIFGQTYGTNITGELYLDGKPVKLRKGAADAIRHKIAYVTEDRKGNGLVLSQSVKVNTSLANLGAISTGTVIDSDKEYAVAEEYREKLKTKTPSVEQLVNNLSGGNQQKVLLAKWMFTEPDVLMMDEPTRGIDVGAKYEIYCIINDLAAAGKSVILVSSELPEVLGMSDRIYIMNEGKFVGEMRAEDATQENIMAAIIRSGKELPQ